MPSRRRVTAETGDMGLDRPGTAMQILDRSKTRRRCDTRTPPTTAELPLGPDRWPRSAPSTRSSPRLPPRFTSSTQRGEALPTQLLIGGQWTAARSGEIEEIRSPFDGSRRRARSPRPDRPTSSSPWPPPSAARWSGGARLPTSGCGSCCGPRSSPTSARRRSRRRSAPRTARRSPRRRPRQAAPATSSGSRPSRAPSSTATPCRWTRTRAPASTRSASPSASRSASSSRSPRSTTRRCWCCTRSRPALAAGNAVVLKPARTTPLTALALAACFVDAGLPEGVLSVLTGPGGALGDLLVADPRVRKVSFTGSTGIGERIAARGRGEEAVAGARRVLPGRDHAGRRPRAGVERGRGRAVSPTRARSASRCSG